jgi:hypothetical protein
LDIDDTPGISGDLRKIGRRDLPSIKQLVIETSVYGGGDLEYRYIDEAPSLMMAR